MGEFLNVMLIVIGVSLVLGLFSLGSQAVAEEIGVDAPPIFLGDYLFGASRDNPLTAQVNTTSWGYTPPGEDMLPSQSTVGEVSTSSSLFPDWVQSAKSWVSSFTSPVISTVKIIVNIVGFPYTIMVNLGFPADVSALVGGAFGTIFFILLVLFVLGRIS